MKRKALPWCPECHKVSSPNEEAAREHLGRLLRHPEPFLKPGRYATIPYPCEYGNGWHVGRKPETLMIDFRRGRVVNLPGRKPQEHA